MNVRPVDIFTFTHFAVGVWLGQWFAPWEVAIGSTIFEVTERWQKRDIPEFSPVPSQDSRINSVLDTVAMTLGAVAVRQAMRSEGLMDVQGRKTSVPEPFSSKTATMLAVKALIFSGVVWYGMNRAHRHALTV